MPSRTPPRPLALLLPLLAVAALRSQDAPLRDLPLRTAFAEQGNVAVPRPEHPRPLLFRERWVTLNGAWEFGLGKDGKLDRTIRVPFAPESALSGLHLRQQVVEQCRYRRTFSVPEAWKGARIVLHFEAVDWEAKVRVDGNEVGVHRGGYDAFAFDVTKALGTGEEHLLEVAVADPADPAKDGWQPRGKQLGSHGIFYTRTTGIWRSVWLEAVPEVAIDRLRTRTTHEGGLEVRAEISGTATAKPKELRVRVLGKGSAGSEVAHECTFAVGSEATRVVVPGIRAWSPSDPALYDLDVVLVDADGKQLDHVRSYCAFRSVDVQGGVFRLNGAPFFYRGVLDQGYWPESGLTAPSDAALEYDVRATKELGLDLARKHVKVEDARWYRWCDQLGLLVMQDMPSSMNLAKPEARANFTIELTEVIRQLESQPCIVHWVVFNEDWGHPEAFQDECVRLVRGLDPTRPLTDASGWTQRTDTDVTDIHDYGPDLARHGMSEAPKRAKVVGECGGVAYSLEGHRWSQGWGYTNAKSGDVYLRKVGRLCEQATHARFLSGFVWTQLTDVEQELNGLLHYDRTDKVDRAELRKRIRAEVPAPAQLAPVSWNVLGPLPSGTKLASAANDAAAKTALAAVLARGFVPSEAALDGKTPVVIDGTPRDWKAIPARAATVDLARVGDVHDNCVCYAHATLAVPERVKVRMEFGSDDAAKVWLDGKPVHEIVAVRGVSLGDDTIEGLVLEPGEHTLLVKVAQGIGGFGFALCFEAE